MGGDEKDLTYEMTWIGEAGVPAAKVSTRRPRTILYRDLWQIIAKPEEATPVTWH